MFPQPTALHSVTTETHIAAGSDGKFFPVMERSVWRYLGAKTVARAGCVCCAEDRMGDLMHASIPQPA